MSATRTLLRHSTAFRHPASFRQTSPLVRAFTSTRPTRDSIPFTIAGTGTGVAQTVSVSGTPSHTIQTDAYAAFGGADSAPSPLHYNLTALSSCTQVTGSVVAKDHGLRLGKWQVDVVGHLDPAVLAKGEADNGNGGNWNAVDLRVKVEVQEAGEEAFERWASEVERRCPVTQLFKRSGVAWTSEWVRL